MSCQHWTSSPKTPVIFEPDELAAWPSGLEVHESLRTVKEGDATILSINVTNNTNHDIALPGRVVLGRLQFVRSVTPVEVRFKDPETPIPDKELPCEENKLFEESESNLSWLPDVDLSGLTAEQKEQAQQLLLEEADAFAMSDNDVGCISELEMDIKMTSDQPVQKNYLSIPRPLYPEVKGYIEDLHNRCFIRKSTSPFSSSVVCVHKKDGGMRLCIDYRELNKKTVPDRHPIPRIQEALDSLGGKSWFTVLDQDKVPTTEKPQAIGGETSMEEDASNQGRPQRVRQGPKRLTYDSPGNPTYVREINAGPPTEINQFGIPPSVPYIPAPPVNQYSMLPPPMTALTPPAVPMMFWRTNMMMPYGMPYPAVPQLPQWEVPYQPFQYG